MPSWLAPLSTPRNRWLCLVLLALTVLCGLASREFAARLPAFVAAHAGDCLWTVAVYLVVSILFPSWPPFHVFALAVAASFLVEFSQLLDTPFLDAIRQTRLGRLLLGSGFLWVDLLRYLVGAACAFTIDTSLALRNPPPTS